MFIRKMCLIFLLALPLPVVAEPATESQDSTSNDSLITLTATVLMPDGSPALGAIVESIERDEDPRNVVHADEAGLIQIRSVFGNGAKIHASSSDGTFQATLMVMAADVRAVFAAPIKLQLEPAVPHVVAVRSEGQSLHEEAAFEYEELQALMEKCGFDCQPMKAFGSWWLGTHNLVLLGCETWAKALGRTPHNCRYSLPRHTPFVCLIPKGSRWLA